jgi:hypothetical protein
MAAKPETRGPVTTPAEVISQTSPVCDGSGILIDQFEISSPTKTTARQKAAITPTIHTAIQCHRGFTSGSCPPPGQRAGPAINERLTDRDMKPSGVRIGGDHAGVRRGCAGTVGGRSWEPGGSGSRRTLAPLPSSKSQIGDPLRCINRRHCAHSAADQAAGLSPNRRRRSRYQGLPAWARVALTYCLLRS